MNSQKNAKLCEKTAKIEFGEVQKNVDIVDLEKCCNSRAQKGPPLTGPFLGQSRYFGFIMVELFILGSRSYVRDF